MFCDQTDKRLCCQQIPSLEEYVSIEQNKGKSKFLAKNHWQSIYCLGEITFSLLEMTLQVEDIYYQVNNEDVLEFLQGKNA